MYKVKVPSSKSYLPKTIMVNNSTYSFRFFPVDIQMDISIFWKRQNTRYTILKLAFFPNSCFI